MAYWWVSQSETWKHEFSGGYLWAPLLNASKTIESHWETMDQVKPGDIVFSYVNQSIQAVSIAKTSAYPSSRPTEFVRSGLWQSEGRRIDLSFQLLANPIPIAQIIKNFQPLLPTKYSPLNKHGKGNQGYLFPLPPMAARFLLDASGAGAFPSGQDLLVTGIENTIPEKTTRKALLDSRIGQGKFRSDLLDLWKGRCSVTGLEIEAVLTASHVKPWRDSDNRERLDPYNGLLLVPSYDSLFDQGFLSFDQTGEVLIATCISNEQLAILGVSRNARIHSLHSKHEPYLEHHRRNVFQG